MQQSVAVTTIPYTLPTLPVAMVDRVNSIEAGAILTCSGTLAHLMVTKAQFGLKYRFKASTTDVWGSYITKYLTMNGDNFSFNAGIGDFDIGTSFNFDILVYDYYSETSRTALLATAKPILSLRAGKIGVGKIPETGALDVAGDIYGNYINSSRGDDIAGAASYIYDTGDGFMRKKSLPNVRAELGGAGNGFNADQVDGIHLLRGSAVGTTPVATAYGSIYYSIDISISFGVTLPSIPVVTNSFTTNGFGYAVLKSISKTGFVIKITNAVTTAGVNWGVNWIAAY